LGQPVVAGFSTHPHWDHLLWHAGLGAAPRYGTARCAATVRDRLSDAGAKARVAALIPPDIAEQVPLDLLGLITGLPAETARIPWDGPQVRIIEHQAHAPGHAALLIEERGVLVAGDMLSDVLIPLLDTSALPGMPSSIAALPASTNRLRHRLIDSADTPCRRAASATVISWARTASTSCSRVSTGTGSLLLLKIELPVTDQPRNPARKSDAHHLPGQKEPALLIEDPGCWADGLGACLPDVMVGRRAHRPKAGATDRWLRVRLAEWESVD
jgi:glyoxylase-like metal-dependent hydrolase (beta-lactamase superfamily II)